MLAIMSKLLIILFVFRHWQGKMLDLEDEYSVGVHLLGSIITFFLMVLFLYWAGLFDWKIVLTKP